MVKKRFSFFKKMSMLIGGFLVLNRIAYALDVEPYYISGLETAFWDSDVPSAIRVKTAEDGFSVGDVLYRTSYKDIDYYSPIAPYTLQGTTSDPNNGKHDGWGPWLMSANKVYRGIESTYYYASGQLNKSSTVYTDNGTTNGSQSVGTLPSGTNIEILGIRAGYAYFSLSKHPGLSNKGSTNVGRVSTSNITYTSSKVTIAYPGYTESSLLTNFKPFGKYWTTLHSGHKGIETGHYVNPNRADVPSSVRGKSGEWRYIGYNAQGEVLDNPYFISDAPGFYNISTFSGYPFRYTPWNPNDKRETGESEQSYAYQRFSIGGKAFKYDTQSEYRNMKRDVINRLVTEGHLSSASDYIDRLSLRTFPTKQATILLGQRKDDVYYRVGFLPLEGGLRDLYVKKVHVIDEDNNDKTVAVWNCNINGNCPATSGTVEKGKRYRIEVTLGNGANSKLLKNTLEAQVGYMYNASKTYSDLPFSKTSNGKRLRMGNGGQMYSTINSASAPFIDYLYVSTSGTIDVYGYVGSSHTGVDNLKYHNDVGVIRLNVQGSSTTPAPPTTPTPPTTVEPNCEITNNGNSKICGKGDIVPDAIKIFSKNEGGKLVYLHEIGKSSPTIREALIPGYEYRVVYSAYYKGTDIIEYDWIPPIQDDPGTPNINEYKPGYWGNPITKRYKVTVDYYVEKYSGGIRDIDSVSKSGYMYYASGDVSDRSVLDIPMVNNAMMGYYVDIYMYEHPYVSTKMTINMPNNRVNGNKSNDSLSTIAKDNFDISINNLKVTPSTTFVSGEEKVNYNVTYNANLLTPSYVGLEHYETVVDTAININGQTYYVKDHLLKGATYNNQITHTIENVSVPSSGITSISVNMNYNKTSYESSNFSNNIATTTVALKKVKNPSTGSVSDKVGTADTLNSNNANKGGDANNNCLVPRLRNTWTTTHGKVEWNSTSITYNKISNNAPVTFKKYKTSYKNTSEATVTYEEQFGIKNIYFRSKYTKDKNYGNDGWVDLLNSSQKNLAIIQAGYGFELKVVTNYSTDAFTKKTWNVWNNGTSGTRVSGMNTKANYGMEDIFVELPGTASTRKILSSTGYEGTVLGLNSSKQISGNTVTWTYTVKPKVTVGIKETPKIFIPEDMKDGDYTLKIYTPPVPGVGSVNKKTYSAMCDRKEVTIKVKGSAMNDLNSHSTQI